MESYRRRSVLAGLGTLVGVSGCTAGESDEDGSPSPASSCAFGEASGRTPADGGRPTGSTPSCSSSRQRSDIDPETVEYGRTGGFEIGVDSCSVQRGDLITVTITNRADADRFTGNRSAYTIHRKAGDSWRSIFWKSADPQPFVDSDAVVHSPGEGFTWELTVTADGLSHEIENGMGSLAVCSPLVSGVYRFLYWGSVGESSAALATRFAVSDS